MLGFGDEVPAFMLITARKRPVVHHHAHVEKPASVEAVAETPAPAPVEIIETVIAEPVISAVVVDAPTAADEQA